MYSGPIKKHDSAPLCKECDFAVMVGDWYCSRVTRDMTFHPVTGWDGFYSSCVKEREGGDDRCGPEGKFFKPMPLARFLRWITRWTPLRR